MKKHTNNEPNISIPLRAVAGMVGALTESLCLAPLDVIKTRIQLAHGYRINMFRMGYNIVTIEGFKALYKGLTPWMAHMLCKYSIRYSMAEYYRRLFSNKKTGEISKINSFIAGFCAGTTEAVLIVTPFETVKIRLQQQRGLTKTKFKYKNPLHCTFTILKEEGPFGLHTGSIPTIFRQGINQFFVFGFYPILKKYLWKKNYTEHINQYQSFITGLIAGAIGPCVNHPFDISKTRIQAQVEKRYYKGVFHCIYRILRDEGVRTLWKGISPRVLRVAGGQGITWTVMELIFRGYHKFKYHTSQSLE